MPHEQQARSAVPDGSPAPNDVEVGWLILGRLDDVDRKAVHQARARTLATLGEQLTEFDWRMPVIERRDLPGSSQLEPSDLFEHGIEERDSGHLDFVIVITGADLIAHGSRPFSLGVSSRALGIGVLSTARIDPLALGVEEGATERTAAIAGRLRALALHVLGDLLGVSHYDQPGSAMALIHSAMALDQVDGYSQDTIQELTPALHQVADLRLEEVRRPPHRIRFFARATWMNAAEIADAIWRARPWELPFRLGRLSAAAVSSLVILLLAAESWELALRAHPGAISLLSGLSLLGALAHILKRQKLLMSRSRVRLTEQIVIANLSAVLTVGLGLLVAFSLLFGLTLLLALLLFPTDLIARWADTSSVGAAELTRVAGLAASVGLIIGTLGASFESQRYFRHIIYVDEELG